MDEKINGLNLYLSGTMILRNEIGHSGLKKEEGTEYSGIFTGSITAGRDGHKLENIKDYYIPLTEKQYTLLSEQMKSSKAEVPLLRIDNTLDINLGHLCLN